MPIRIPDALPATAEVEVELLQTASHDSKNTAAEHLEAFYTTFDAVRDEHFDGLIITGAPVERLEFEEVDYWLELCEIMEWSKTHVHSTLHICWGAQAGIYYHYGVPKHELPEKMQTASHDSKNTAAEHLEAFYTTFDAVRDEHFDGLIITGAPVERLEFEEVDYWLELCEIMEWSKTHVHSTLHICWGAQAGIYYHYGVPKHELPEKMFGVFPHELPEKMFGVFPHEVVKRTSPLVRGFDDRFFAPHSRFTARAAREDVRRVPPRGGQAHLAFGARVRR